MKFVKPKKRESEEPIVDIKFNIHKLNGRPKPEDKRRILIISCLSEFGCETLALLYCIPRILQDYGGMYVIVIGWYGREYLYRHLADEFWELKEDFQWLRDYTIAFHNNSKNLKVLEKNLSKMGNLCPAGHLASMAIANRCRKCRHTWREDLDDCPKCGSHLIVKCLFQDTSYWKRTAVRLPPPSSKKILEASKYTKSNAVGIFARGRKTYGRNLQPEFYIKLITMLREMGYNPVWLGEKQSTQECPVDDVVDFSRMEESRDLELTLAIVKQCKFTVQFWTASTRLAGMQGVPYLLFESPDQIWGVGQEGYRRKLCDFGKSKLCVNQFLNVLEDNDAGLELVERCIKEMEDDNYEDVFGLLETDFVAHTMKESKKL